MLLRGCNVCRIFCFVSEGCEACRRDLKRDRSPRDCLDPHLAPLGFPRAMPLALVPLGLLPRTTPPRTPLAATSPPPRL